MLSVSAQDDGEFKTKTQNKPAEKEKKKKEESDEKAFKEGTLAITLGYGFPNLYKSIYKGLIVNTNSLSNLYNYDTYAYTSKGLGPLFVKADYGLTKLIGIGIIGGYFNAVINETRTYTVSEYDSGTGNYYNAVYQDKTDYNYSSLSIGARINFHFGTGEKLDPYAGVGAGYSLNQSKLTYSTNNPNTIARSPYSGTGIPTYFAITVGMRYYFTPNIGIYGEIGFDKWSLIQGGLAIKF